MELGGSA